MAITVFVSQKELQRVAALAYEGETLKVMLASIGANTYTAETAVATWQTVEKSGNGYVRYSEVIGTGAWDGIAGAYVMPDIDAEFTATGAGYSYDRIVFYIDGATYPYAVLTESPNIALAAGQTQTYRISLRQDD
jgi:hypothetical protein